MSVLLGAMNWWWIELPPIGFRLKHGPLTKAQGWHGNDFSGVDEAEVEEDLLEVEDSWFATITEDQDTMPMIALIQRIRRASIPWCLIMKWKTILRW